MTSQVSTFPTWLPDPIEFKGDWDSFIRSLYAVFEADFKHGYPRYMNCPVWHNHRIQSWDTFGFEEGFWHLVTTNQRVWNTEKRRYEKQRLPDFDRAGRLPWTKPTADHDAEPEVLAWDFEQDINRGTVVRSYLWLKDHDFVVILERQTRSKGDIFMLITSFLLTHEGKRRDLQSRYERRKK